MKKANDLLDEIKKAVGTMADDCYRIDNHPAAELDDYMKEQYMILLFSVVARSEKPEKQAISYILNIAGKIGFNSPPDEIVKYVYSLDEKKLNDCGVSFRDEEIKYLLGFELYVIADFFIKSAEAGGYLKNLYQHLEISADEQKRYSMINDVLRSNKLSEYTMKEKYTHSNILKCYLCRFDFKAERVLIVSNCLKSVGKAGSSYGSFDGINTPVDLVYFKKAHFISDFEPRKYDYVEKGTELGHFIAMIGGFGLCQIWYREERKMAERELITPLFKDYNPISGLLGDDYLDENTYEVRSLKAEKSGIFYFMYNGIGEYNDPFAVISHQLDDENDVLEYLNECISKSREKNAAE